MADNGMTTIGDVAVVFDGPHATPKKIDTGPYFLSISSLDNGKLDLSKSAHLSEEQFTKWTRRVTPQEGDLLFSYETRLGDAALVPPDVKCCLGRRMGLLRPDRDKVLPAYLLYAYLSPDFQSTIDQRKVLGSTVDRISLTDLPSFPIRIPPLPEQKAIAHILGSLDDKIELNRQMNATLEGMAQTLFKSWFVDFDPVLDNALVAGNPIPGALAERAEVRRQALANGNANREAAAPFPNAFQANDEFGWLPEGWASSIYDDVVEVTDGRHDSPKRVMEGFSLITSKHLKKWNIDFDTAYLISEADYVRRNEGRTVYKYDILISLIGTVGTLYFVMAENNHYSIKNIGLFKSSQKPLLSEYLYLFLDSNFGKHYLTARMAGTTQSYLTHASLRELPVFLPPEQILQVFRQSVNPQFAKIHDNIKQSQTLAELRDTLLPKLISGELRLPDAEKLAEEILA